MKSGYLQTVSTVAIGSIALGAAMTKKAEAQDTGYALSFSGGIGEASGLTFASGGFGTSDPGYFGAIVVSKPFGDIEGSVGLSFYNQESRNNNLSGFSGPSGGGSFYAREFTSWTALDVMASRQTSTPGFSWGAGMRAMKAEHGSAFGTDGVTTATSGGGLSSFNSEQGVRASFVGLGPRISAKYATAPVAGKFGFSGEAGLSALFGKHKQEYFETFSLEGAQVGSSGGETSDNFLATIDLTLQADYHLSENTKIFAGVQAQRFLDFADEFNEGSASTESVFMGFKTEF